jgi:hypothetical protein
MAGGSAIRGSRVGAGPMGESERGQSIPKSRISYWCADGHETSVAFAIEAEGHPELWDCPRCGAPAGQDEKNPPRATKTEPYKTHLAYVKERRSDEEVQSIVQESFDNLKSELSE